MFTIEAEVRNVQGKGASRRLRNANKFPAIVYGGEAAPVAIELVFLWLLFPTRGAALKLIAQVRRRTFNGQRIGGRIPKDAFTQQHRVKVDG